MEIFFENWKEARPGSNCLLFRDNLGAHKAIEMIEKMLDEKIFLFFFRKTLPTFCNPWIQPHLALSKNARERIMKALNWALLC